MSEYYLTCDPQINLTNYEFTFETHTGGWIKYSPELDGSAKIVLTENGTNDFLFSFPTTDPFSMYLRAVGPSPAFVRSDYSTLLVNFSIVFGSPAAPDGLAIVEL